MGLGTLPIGSNSYIDIGSGRYILSTTQFGGARDEFRLTAGRPGRKNEKGFTMTSAAITYLRDFTVALPDGTQQLRPLTATLQLQVPEGITVEGADLSVGMISELVTEAFLNRLLSGAS